MRRASAADSPDSGILITGRSISVILPPSRRANQPMMSCWAWAGVRRLPSGTMPSTAASAMDFLYSSRCSLESQYDQRCPFTIANVTGMMTCTLSNLLPWRHSRADELLVLGVGPGQRVDDELVADILQTIDASADPGRRDQHVHLAHLFS